MVIWDVDATRYSPASVHTQPLMPRFRSAVVPTGTPALPSEKLRVLDASPLTLTYTTSVKAPQRPLCASNDPMNANLRLSMMLPESAVIVLLLSTGKMVVPLMLGNQPYRVAV